MSKVITNNVPRDIIEAWELTPAEREDFDFLDWEAIEKGDDSAQFFRYKGELSYLGDFMRGGVNGWDGSRADGYFSGLVVRYVYDEYNHDDPRVVVGLWLA